MVGSYLLDTNIIIALFAQDAMVKQHLTGAGEVFIPRLAVVCRRTLTINAVVYYLGFADSPQPTALASTT